jgi:iron complex outermembrane recepter protein
VDFQYRDLPAASSPMLDRAGVASLYGTIPTQRAIVSVMFQRERFSATVFLRHHSAYRDPTSYEDPSNVAGAATDRRIRAQTLVDLRITTKLGDHLTLSFGANNVLDDQPPFARIGGWEGYDSSQGDLLGREAFFDITGAF